MTGRYDEAVAGATAVLQMRPGFGPALRVAIAAHALGSRLDKAREAVAAHAALEPETRLSSLRDNYLHRVTPEQFEILAEGLSKAGFSE
jgi:hypothetical protein